VFQRGKIQIGDGRFIYKVAQKGFHHLAVAEELLVRRIVRQMLADHESIIDKTRAPGKCFIAEYAKLYGRYEDALATGYGRGRNKALPGSIRVSLNKPGNPPALPGDPKSLTIPAIRGKPPFVSRSMSKGGFHETGEQLKSYEVGLQVSYSLDTEAPAQNSVWQDMGISRAIVSQVGRGERMPDHRRASLS
jgi:hypothetical protein